MESKVADSVDYHHLLPMRQLESIICSIERDIFNDPKGGRHVKPMEKAWGAMRKNSLSIRRR